MLTLNNTSLLIIDVQGLLAKIMFNREFLYDSLKKLIQGMQTLQVPIYWFEQNPERMGGTVPEIASVLPAQTPISKMTFSCCGSEEFMRQFTADSRQQVILAGIEAHVCVYQTAMDLLKNGYRVTVAADAVSSRTQENRQIGLNRMVQEGVCLSSVEMALFELLRTAESNLFRQILKIIK